MAPAHGIIQVIILFMEPSDDGFENKHLKNDIIIIIRYWLGVHCT